MEKKTKTPQKDLRQQSIEEALFNKASRNVIIAYTKLLSSLIRGKAIEEKKKELDSLIKKYPAINREFLNILRRHKDEKA